MVFSLSPSYVIIVGMSQNEQKQREEFTAVVAGRVQGVGFRYFVIGKARILGLQGYVRNDSAGNVEVIAQGTRPMLEQLLVLLRQGPPAAEVYDVSLCELHGSCLLSCLLLSLILSFFLLVCQTVVLISR